MASKWKGLRCYMAYDRGSGGNPVSVLVFAFDQSELMRIGCAALRKLEGTKRNMVGTKLLTRNTDFFLSQADKEKLALREGHYVADMSCCPQCGLWGEEWPDPDGACGYCGYDPILG